MTQTTTSAGIAQNLMLGEVDDDFGFSQLELEVEFLKYFIKRDNPEMGIAEVHKKAVSEAKEMYEDFA